jgi:hypothetical protein
VKKRNGKPILPKRLCADPQTKYCKGKYGHRGCCECSEYNHGTEWREQRWAFTCNPFLLPEKQAELKEWWLANDMGPWEDEPVRGRGRQRKYLKRPMGKRGR